MIVMVIMIVGMRVGNSVVSMFMRVGRAGRRRARMRMIVMLVIMGVFVSMSDSIVAVRMGMF
jgi:hypothetical protein